MQSGKLELMAKEYKSLSKTKRKIYSTPHPSKINLSKKKKGLEIPLVKVILQSRQKTNPDGKIISFLPDNKLNAERLVYRNC